GDWAVVIHNALMYVSGAPTGIEHFDPLAPVLAVRLATAPNPAQFAATVSYAVPRGGPVQLSVFDQSGRLVRSLFAGQAKTGVNSLVWNLRDDAGQVVSKGVYFCKLVAQDKTLSRKLVVR
ncbi:T9SS type A sorting domain-containing protein, partial [candidate division WOR-3 bacterium]|nr:T9SS type A sorting domain-containing protein [candidate division WOR-3 bacterium]